MITITHDAHATTADGTSRGDSAGPILKRAGGFMWSRAQGTWVLNRTWHLSTRELKVRSAAAALEAAGIPVTVERGDMGPAVTTAGDVAAAEAARAQHAETRADYLDGKAERLAAQADAGFARAREMASIIPLGQPILIGHHSERRDRNYRARINSTEDRALEAHNAAEDTSRRAASAANTQAHRESLPATLRRIATLEAERRDVTRRLDGDGRAGVRYMPDGSIRTGVGASGEYRDQLTTRGTELDAQLDYWRQHVDALAGAGVKVYSRKDFAPGDWARVRGGRWMLVVKANPKNLKLQSEHMPWPLDYPYGDVTGHRTAAEHATATIAI